MSMNVPFKPKVQLLEPPVLVGKKGHRGLGFNHPQLAMFLCPVKHLEDFIRDPKDASRTHLKLKDGQIKVNAQNLPAFLYEGKTPGEHFSPDAIDKGLLKGYYLLCVSVFCGPRSARSKIGSMKQSTRAHNVKKHGMTRVTPQTISYAAVQDPLEEKHNDISALKAQCAARKAAATMQTPESEPASTTPITAIAEAHSPSPHIINSPVPNDNPPPGPPQILANSDAEDEDLYQMPPRQSAFKRPL
ncbi:hypothetical protein SERLADRAFT_443035 [Serpula lacrymans var. lacrymans S7.9]|uniref:Uncharacterized protein n=1 Tax=Serpula lacrymans var. lacrymans (strain S7.9) TaxID=578457 RepID=F8PBC7_SERL9|nr:uncharacterized protein SERLADRAFT_443035 [Serpula lacrymans var. lacrymans S7.9]EGO19567.1 hypothetical protein SERLADRAFT_443035 [Serpula lacrymans var. lacrymans S7.9]